MSSYSLLACKVSSEKSADSLMVVLLHIDLIHLEFFLSLTFDSLIIMYLGEDLFELNLMRIL